MNEEEFKKKCPNLYDSFIKNRVRISIYNNSISFWHNGGIPFECSQTLRDLENEKYIVYFKFQFKKELTPQNLN